MTRTNVFATAIAASISLTMLAGCPAPNQNTAAPGTATGGTSATGGTTSTGSTTTGSTTTGSTTTGSTTTGSTTTGQTASNATPDGATVASASALESAQEESTVEGYDAVAGDSEHSASTPTAFEVLDVAATPAATTTTTTTTTDTTASGGSTTTSTSADASATVAVAPPPTIAPPTVGSAAPAPTPPKARPAAHKGLTAKQREQIEARRKRLLERNRKRLLAGEEGMIRQLLEAAHWNHGADGILVKDATGSVKRTNAKGQSYSRTITLHREIKAVGHELISATTDISETFPPGGTNTIHWEKTLQADGSYDVVFHHTRVYGAAGTGPTRDAVWHKNIKANGDIVGTGVITWTDKMGKVTSTETISIGGSEESTQKLNPVVDSGTPPVIPADQAAAGAPAVAASTTKS